MGSAASLNQRKRSNGTMVNLHDRMYYVSKRIGGVMVPLFCPFEPHDRAFFQQHARFIRSIVNDHTPSAMERYRRLLRENPESERTFSHLLVMDRDGGFGWVHSRTCFISYKPDGMYIWYKHASYDRLQARRTSSGHVIYAVPEDQHQAALQTWVNERPLRAIRRAFPFQDM
jgi:hypothetical protein